MQYRILLITSFQKPWNNGWFYKIGFEKNGHIVTTFDPNSEVPSDEMILNIAKNIKPDFVIYTKNELPVEIFQNLKKFTKIIQWYPDPIIPRWLPPYIKTVDIFFTISEGMVDEIRKLNPHSFWLTQAFEPSFFKTKEITDNDKKTFGSDITFVGNLGSKTQYLIRRKYLNRVLREGFQLKWWGPKIPKKLSTIFIIFGRLGKAYGGKFIWGEEYAKVAKLSKIFLAFDSMPHMRKSMSARMYTAVGCGAFYMCQYVDGIEEVLVPDKEIITFSSDVEMIDKIKFYLHHEEIRKRIAENGKKRVLNEHTYEIRIKQMLKIIESVL